MKLSNIFIIQQNIKLYLYNTNKMLNNFVLFLFLVIIKFMTVIRRLPE